MTQRYVNTDINTMARYLYSILNQQNKALTVTSFWDYIQEIRVLPHCSASDMSILAELIPAVGTSTEPDIIQWYNDIITIHIAVIKK